MTLEQLASTLSRKPEGLRMALLKPTEDWARQLKAARVYVGRRMYFPTDMVAALLSNPQNDRPDTDGDESLQRGR